MYNYIYKDISLIILYKMPYLKTNIDRRRETGKERAKRFYENNKEKVLLKKTHNYYCKCEIKLLMNILHNDI